MLFVKLYFYIEKIFVGHFVNHRDTTHSMNHHATLLVEIPSVHTGGDLVGHWKWQ